MAILEIIEAPDARLKKVAKPVTSFDKKLKKLAKDMLETMYSASGIGLAATQVGVEQRVLVLDVSQVESVKEPQVFVNPVISSKSEQTKKYTEGCLSFPGQYADVERPEQVTIDYQDIEGNTHSLQADELLAVCIQHEIDHLDGKVFVDYVSRMKRDSIIRKLKKSKKLAVNSQ